MYEVYSQLNQIKNQINTKCKYKKPKYKDKSI